MITGTFPFSSYCKIANIKSCLSCQMKQLLSWPWTDPLTFCLFSTGGRLLCLVLWLNLVPVMNGCPAKCVCYSEPRPTVACQQQGLFSIPTEIPVRSQRIFLQSNKLTVIRSTSFSSVHNLTVLWMYSNNISHIEAGPFTGWRDWKN